MALNTKQKYGLGIAVVAIILLIAFWKRISSFLGITEKVPGDGIRRASASLPINQTDLRNLRLNSMENTILNKYANDLSNLGLRSEADVRANSAAVQAIVGNMNKSLRNIGSNSTVSFGDPATMREKCIPDGPNESCFGIVVLWGFIRWCKCRTKAQS